MTFSIQYCCNFPYQYYYLLNTPLQLQPSPYSQQPSQGRHLTESPSNFIVNDPNNQLNQAAAIVQDQEHSEMPMKVKKSKRKRDKNPEREKISAKKNSQSNIINHYFTCFSTKQCSQLAVKRIILSLKKQGLDLQKSFLTFYSIIRMVNMIRGRKYMNKSILMSLFSQEGLEDNLTEFLKKIQNADLFTISEISRILRKSLLYFMREMIFSSIMTSKRISILSKRTHLQKRRKIQRYICKREETD